MDEKKREKLEKKIIEALKTVYDPEIPVNVYDLGLIYNISITEEIVFIDMTLTAPTCPIAENIVADVATQVRKVPGIPKVEVNLVWEPMWNQDMLSEAAKLQLGIF
ncbi:MAG TPA: DUF59 domain-containing protein [Candidatus Marinimicrobia bacterium]|nr:DUF59 domain-containing protein [Candidatus Neomarinimicrobiota bacterium]